MQQWLLFRLRDRYVAAEAALKLMDLYSRQMVPQSELALESSLASYEGGSVDFLTVLSNFTMIRDYQMNYHEQQAEYLKALSGMAELTGSSAAGSTPASGVAGQGGAAMKNFLIGFILAAVLVSGGYWIISRQNTSSRPADSSKGAEIPLPHASEYVSDKPGDCPICGMKLVPIEGEAAPQAAAVRKLRQPSPGQRAKPERKILYWTDAMNPGSRYDKPGKAPDGMDLVPVYAEEAPGDTGPGVPGYAPVKIPPERLQMMGVTRKKPG